MLLESGADINAIDEVGDTPVMMAVKSGDAGIVKVLLDKGADVAVKERYFGRTALHISAQVADADMMRTLMARSGDVNLRDNEGNTPLLIAAGWNTDVVKALIEKGADVNAKNNHGTTCLMRAIGSIQAVKVFLEKGADVNAKDVDGWTPLEQALLRGCPDVIQLLEKAGAKE